MPTETRGAAAPEAEAEHPRMRRPASPEASVTSASLAGCFTAEPSAARAHELHASYRGLMRRQFLEALTAAAEGLDLDLSPLSRQIEELSPNERLSPAAYVALTTLTEALRSGNVTQVSDRLQALSVMPEQELRDAAFRIQPVLTEPWETPFIESVRSDPIEELKDEERIVRPLVGRDPGPEIAACEAALGLLEEVDPALAGEFREYVNRVKLFAGHGYLGFSSPAAFGAIFIRIPDANPLEHFLEHLVHELSHLCLNVLMAHDPLLRNPTDPGPAPLRANARPLYQILHATFVLSRNIRVTRRVVERHPELGYEAALRNFEEKHLEGFRTVQALAEFTEPGRRLFQSLEPLPG